MKVKIRRRKRQLLAAKTLLAYLVEKQDELEEDREHSCSDICMSGYSHRQKVIDKQKEVVTSMQEAIAYEIEVSEE